MTDLSIPLYYEIYLQDLSKPYMDLVYLGKANTQEEARTCCTLFREALNTADSRGIKNVTNSTVIFRPILKGG